MKLKSLTVVAMALSLGACASVPPPPYCDPNGQGLQPINPEMLTQEQINIIRSSANKDDKYEYFVGEGGDK